METPENLKKKKSINPQLTPSPSLTTLEYTNTKIPMKENYDPVKFFASVVPWKGDDIETEEESDTKSESKNSTSKASDIAKNSVSLATSRADDMISKNNPNYPTYLAIYYYFLVSSEKTKRDDPRFQAFWSNIVNGSLPFEAAVAITEIVIENKNTEIKLGLTTGLAILIKDNSSLQTLAFAWLNALSSTSDYIRESDMAGSLGVVRAPTPRLDFVIRARVQVLIYVPESLRTINKFTAPRIDKPIDLYLNLFKKKNIEQISQCKNKKELLEVNVKTFLPLFWKQIKGWHLLYKLPAMPIHDPKNSHNNINTYEGHYIWLNTYKEDKIYCIRNLKAEEIDINPALLKQWIIDKTIKFSPVIFDTERAILLPGQINQLIAKDSKHHPIDEDIKQFILDVAPLAREYIQMVSGTGEKFPGILPKKMKEIVWGFLPQFYKPFINNPTHQFVRFGDDYYFIAEVGAIGDLYLDCKNKVLVKIETNPEKDNIALLQIEEEFFKNSGLFEPKEYEVQNIIAINRTISDIDIIWADNTEDYIKKLEHWKSQEKKETGLIISWPDSINSDSRNFEVYFQNENKIWKKNNITPKSMLGKELRKIKTEKELKQMELEGGLLEYKKNILPLLIELPLFKIYYLITKYQKNILVHVFSEDDTGVKLKSVDNEEANAIIEKQKEKDQNEFIYPGYYWSYHNKSDAIIHLGKQVPIILLYEILSLLNDFLNHRAFNAVCEDRILARLPDLNAALDEIEKAKKEQFKKLKLDSTKSKTWSELFSDFFDKKKSYTEDRQESLDCLLFDVIESVSEILTKPMTAVTANFPSKPRNPYPTKEQILKDIYDDELEGRMYLRYKIWETGMDPIEAQVNTYVRGEVLFMPPQIPAEYKALAADQSKENSAEAHARQLNVLAKDKWSLLKATHLKAYQPLSKGITTQDIEKLRKGCTRIFVQYCIDLNNSSYLVTEIEYGKKGNKKREKIVAKIIDGIKGTELNELSKKETDNFFELINRHSVKSYIADMNDMLENNYPLELPFHEIISNLKSGKFTTDDVTSIFTTSVTLFPHQGYDSLTLIERAILKNDKSVFEFILKKHSENKTSFFQHKSSLFTPEMLNQHIVGVMVKLIYETSTDKEIKKKKKREKTKEVTSMEFQSWLHEKLGKWISFATSLIHCLLNNSSTHHTLDKIIASIEAKKFTTKEVKSILTTPIRHLDPQLQINESCSAIDLAILKGDTSFFEKILSNSDLLGITKEDLKSHVSNIILQHANTTFVIWWRDNVGIRDRQTSAYGSNPVSPITSPLTKQNVEILQSQTNEMTDPQEKRANYASANPRSSSSFSPGFQYSTPQEGKGKKEEEGEEQDQQNAITNNN